MILKTNFLSTVCLLTSCGVFTAKRTDPPTPVLTPTFADSTSTCGAAALALFEDNVQTAIDPTCSECHESGSAANVLRMPSGDPVTSRANLFKYTGLEETKITQKFKNHSGGDLSATLTQTEISLWIAGEKNCQ